jgi:hypothetical protein
MRTEIIPHVSSLSNPLASSQRHSRGSEPQNSASTKSTICAQLFFGRNSEHGRFHRCLRWAMANQLPLTMPWLSMANPWLIRGHYETWLMRVEVQQSCKIALLR